ncbi:MAG: hypothetical protein WC378_10915 [Opitutaceae bacterium]
MNNDPQSTREPSLIDIEILDLGPLYEQAVAHYISLDLSRQEWPEEKRGRLRIRTECRWGRVQFAPEACFMVNERGEGPREPLSSSVKAHVALYAEMLPLEKDQGFFESQPFCQVPIDAESAGAFQTLGMVALEDFIRAKIPEMEVAYQEWVQLLQSARSRIFANRAKQLCRASK